MPECDLGSGFLAQTIAIYLQEEGEKTVVLRSENPDLQALEAKAQSLLLPTFLGRGCRQAAISYA